MAYYKDAMTIEKAKEILIHERDILKRRLEQSDALFLQEKKEAFDLIIQILENQDS